jgi:tRNA(Arg) A34 adenosine deaminase TadA
MDYLKQAVDLSRKSLEAGEFPAGAVLVTKGGNTFTSDPSVAWYHGECMVIDKAIIAEGYPLKDAVIYASMESCLMCSTKMYWAGVNKVYYVIPKSSTNTQYAYEDNRLMNEHTASFYTPLESIHDDTLHDEALSLYKEWVIKIESKL